MFLGLLSERQKHACFTREPRYEGRRGCDPCFRRFGQIASQFHTRLDKSPTGQTALLASVYMENGSSRGGAIMKQPSVLEWYRILRAHHLFTIFQAIRYALWLTRSVPFVGRSCLRKRPGCRCTLATGDLILKRSETCIVGYASK